MWVALFMLLIVNTIHLLELQNQLAVSTSINGIHLPIPSSLSANVEFLHDCLRGEVTSFFGRVHATMTRSVRLLVGRLVRPSLRHAEVFFVVLCHFKKF